MNKIYLNLMFKQLVLILCLSVSSGLYSQIATVISGGAGAVNGSYTSFSAAITALNGATITAPVYVNLAAGNTETLSAPILMTATGTASAPIIIKRSGTGANPLLTSYSGTNIANVTTVTTIDGMFILQGSDYVSIDGLDLTEATANITTTSQMEVGFGLFMASATNGCQYDTIRNCNTNFLRASLTNGTTWTGSTAIALANAIWTSVNTLVTPTSTAGTNSYNLIESNILTGGSCGVSITGNKDATGALVDLGNVVKNNTITDFGNASTNSVHGILMVGQHNSVLSKNTISSSLTSKHSGTINGIFYANATFGGDALVDSNTITMHGGGTSQAIQGIRFQSGIASAVVTVSNNNIINSTYTTATSGNLFGLLFTGSAGTYNAINNTISNNSNTSTVFAAGTTTMISVTTGTPVNVNIIGNKVLNNSNLNGTCTSCTSPTRIFDIGVGTNVLVKDNIIDGYEKQNGVSTTTVGNYSGIYVGGGTNTTYIKNNTVKNLKYTGTGTGAVVYGIISASVCADLQIDSNSIDSLMGQKATSSSIIAGIALNSSAPVSQKFRANTISNLSTLGSGIVYGIHTHLGSGTKEISFNTIRKLTSNGNNVFGINTLLADPLIFNNSISNLTSTGNGISANVTGIALVSTVTGSTAGIYNNIISDLNPNPSSTSALSVQGIQVSAAANVYYNTIFLNNLNSQTLVVNGGTCGINVASATAAIAIKNNIINNNFSSSGTGVSAALRRSTAGTNGTFNPTLTLNNNIYYITPGTNNFFYAEGITMATLANSYFISGGTPVTGQILDSNLNTPCSFYKSFSNDLYSYSENNLSGTATTYKPTNPSFTQNSGLSGLSITNDYTNGTRSTTPDMGALEFSGTTLDAVPPTITYTPFSNTVCTTNPTLTASITDLSGVNLATGLKPRVYFKISTEADALPATNTSASNGWKWVEASNTTSPFSFTLNYSLLSTAVVSGNTIQYFVVAQDSAAMPNVNSFNVTLNSGYCPTSVDLSAAAFPTVGSSSFTINTVPATITTNSNITSVCQSGSATLSIVGTPFAGASYQWQSSTNGGTSYSNISGATADSLKNQAVTSTTMFRAAILCGATPISSSPTSPVTVTVTQTPNITVEPAAQTTLCEGNSFTLTTTSSNTVSKQWFRNGVLLTGKTDSFITISNATIADSGNYTMIAYGAAPCINDTTIKAHVTINIGINITKQANSLGLISVCQGQPFSLVTHAIGDSALVWKKITNNVTTSTSYIVDSVVFSSSTLADSGKYFVEFKGYAPCSLKNSDTVQVVVNPLASVITDPMGTKVCAGSTITLTAVTTKAVNHVWLKNNAPISAGGNISIVNTATGSTLTIINSALTDSGDYKVIAISAGTCLNDTSNVVAVVKVIKNITITTQPISVTVCQNTPFSLTVVATGDSSRFWTKIGGAISNTTNTLSVASAQISDTGRYFISYNAFSPCSNKNSDTVQVVVNPLALVSTDPVGTKVCAGSTITLTAATTKAVNHIWLKNNAPISAGGNISITNTASGSTLTIINSVVTDSGDYKVIAVSAGTCLNDTSNVVVVVKVIKSITITTQPSTVNVCQNTPFSLTAVTTGDSSRSWNKIGGSISNTTNTYSVTSTQLSDTGRYFIFYKAFSPCPNINTDTVNVYVKPNALIVTDPATLSTICEGQTVTLKGTYSNSLGYQWLKNGIPISGAINDSLVVTASTLADSGSYRVIVLSPSGCINDTSDINTGIVKIKKAVSISTQPVYSNVCENGLTNFTVSATDATGYQWKLNNIDIPSATSSTYSISNTLAVNGGVYTVSVLGVSPCPAILSDTATLNVVLKAKISTQPRDTIVCQNINLAFSTSSTNAISYQWQFNQSNISSANSSNYSKSNVQSMDSGMYRVIAISANNCKNDTSISVLGKVLPAPKLTLQPVPTANACIGASFSLNASVGNSTSVVWTKNGTNTLYTNPSLLIPNFTLSDTGVYKLVVNGNSPCPSTISDSTIIGFIAAASFTVEPPVVLSKCIGDSLKIKISASNTTNYIWKKNGVILSGQNSDSLNINSLVASDSGIYTVIAVAQSGCINDTSNSMTLSLFKPITISTQPISNSVLCEGNNLNLNISTNNPSGITYQWYKNNTPISYFANSLQKTSISVLDSGTYFVSMSAHPSCPTVISSLAQVVVNKSPKILSNPTSTSPICEGTSFSINADVQNYTSLIWYKNNIALVDTGKIFNRVVSGLSDIGSYKIKAISLQGCIDSFSLPFNLDIKEKVRISAQPIGTSLIQDPSTPPYTMKVSASGFRPFTYIWKKNGVVIPAAMDSFYTITNYNASVDTGNYAVEVFSGAPCSNSEISSIAQIKNYTCPVINVQPISTLSVCEGSGFTLSVTAIGAKSYNWYFNNTPISGQNSRTLTISNLTANNQGIYKVEIVPFSVTTCPQLFSTNTVMTVVSKPIITSQPSKKIFCNPTSHTMSVAASGGTIFQWFKNDQPIVGATNSTLTYQGINTFGDSVYVTVANNYCPGTKSQVIYLKAIEAENHVYLAPNSMFNMVEQCMDHNGFTYYSNKENADSFFLAINKKDNSFKSIANIEVQTQIVEKSSLNAENRGILFGNRSFNLTLDANVTNSYDVKFYFSANDRLSIENRYATIKKIEGKRFTAGRADSLAFITSTQVSMSNSLLNNVSIPLNFSHYITTDISYGTDNGLNYAIIKNLTSKNGGGTMFMDYYLKASSALQTNKENVTISLYPVPAINELTLEAKGNSIDAIDIKIIDITGRVVHEDNYIPKSLFSKEIIDISHLNSGIYLLEFIQNDIRKVLRFEK